MPTYIYPTYDTLHIAQKKNYPSGVQFTTYSAQVPLQHMVDHVVMRIVEAHSSLFEFIFTTIYKWGCDSSSLHSTYRQDVKCDNNNLIDEYLFAMSHYKCKRDQWYFGKIRNLPHLDSVDP